jgi:hypothetical protein
MGSTPYSLTGSLLIIGTLCVSGSLLALGTLALARSLIGSGTLDANRFKPAKLFKFIDFLEERLEQLARIRARALLQFR